MQVMEAWDVIENDKVLVVSIRAVVVGEGGGGWLWMGVPGSSCGRV